MNRSKEKEDLLNEMLAIGRSFSESKSAQNGTAKEPEDISLFDDDSVPTTALGEEEPALKGPFLVDMATNRAYPIEKEKSVIGCGSSCDIIIEDDPVNHTVSRSHCVITKAEGRIYLEDISSNGTSVGALGMAEDRFFHLPGGLLAEIRPYQVVSFAGRRFILVVSQ